MILVFSFIISNMQILSLIIQEIIINQTYKPTFSNRKITTTHRSSVLPV